MSLSSSLLNAAGVLTDAVHDAYLDAAYSPFRLQLEKAHDVLTTEMYLIQKNAAQIDAGSAAVVQAAVNSCGAASQALSSAATPAQRSKAISLTFAAIDAIRSALPASVHGFI